VDPLIGFALAHAEQAPLDDLETVRLGRVPIFPVRCPAEPGVK
jgi:hypothetical protein